MVGVVGGGILIYGLWGVMAPEKPVVEIIKASQRSDNSPRSEQGSELSGEIVVDVAGEVEKPGVYKLPTGSRIGDALVVAGGLSEKADRDWVAKTLNLAKQIKDQEKIYIPGSNVSNNQTPIINNQTSSYDQNSKLVNINTASVGELDSLPGIGEVRAQAIVANRPYVSTEEIIAKAKVPSSVYESIKDKVSTY